MTDCKTLVFKISIILILSSFLSRFSYGDSLDYIISNIQQSYDAIYDFEARFVQESRVKSWSAAQVQKAEGVVYFKKEGKMCWDYQKPTPQRIISDGKKSQLTANNSTSTEFITKGCHPYFWFYPYQAEYARERNDKKEIAFIRNF